MGRVKILPEDVRKKIAAGEVIERPSSVVKELIENSIDAGASRIVIEIEDGGKRLIRISDNGEGILSDDLPLVIHRYSTSKLYTREDLSNIRTMGFRGEALSSIASVSILEILTRSREEETGRMIRVMGGEIKEDREYQRQVGTTVVVKNLFYNYPSRRKFLHSANAEFRAILGELIPRFISFSGIQFELYHNGQKIYHLLPGSLEDRISNVFGYDFLKDFLPFETEDDEIGVMGYVQKPNVKSPRKYYLFVNRRSVWNPPVMKFLQNVYNLPAGERPSFIIFFDIPPHLVDVNVHPQKKEVLFVDEHRVLSKLGSAIQEIIGEAGEYRIELVSSSETPLFPDDEHALFWQVHNSYILTQTKRGLVIIDQHAAHERIIFERLLSEPEFPTQTLLFPIQLTFSPLEIQKLREIEGVLKRFGFRFRFVSGNSVIWEGVPAILDNAGEDSLRDMVREITTENRTGLEKVLESIACHSAIKQGDPLSPEEMASLIEQLFSTRNPYTCPHGRPTLIEITLEELETKFRRR